MDCRGVSDLKAEFSFTVAVTVVDSDIAIDDVTSADDLERVDAHAAGHADSPKLDVARTGGNEGCCIPRTIEIQFIVSRSAKERHRAFQLHIGNNNTIVAETHDQFDAAYAVERVDRRAGFASQAGDGNVVRTSAVQS